MDKIKKTVLEILKGIHPQEDMEDNNRLLEDGILDSFDIITLLSEINEKFDIVISADKIVPENFNSPQAIANLIYNILNEE